MAFNVKKAGNNNPNRVEQPIIEPDVYTAYLVQMIDFGLQPQKPFKGKDKPPCQEIMLTYELSDVYMVDEDGKEDESKPRWISETLPFYGLFADKAKSTQRYLAFDPKDEFDGDFSKAIGMPCNVTIVNNVVGDKTYTNVANVAGISAKKAAAMEDIKNPTKVFSVDEPDMDVYAALPKWVQEKIASNLEFKGSVLEAALAGKPAAKADAPKAKAKAKPVEEDDSDDNPY